MQCPSCGLLSNREGKFCARCGKPTSASRSTAVSIADQKTENLAKTSNKEVPLVLSYSNTYRSPSSHSIADQKTVALAEIKNSAVPLDLSYSNKYRSSSSHSIADQKTVALAEIKNSAVPLDLSYIKQYSDNTLFEKQTQYRLGLHYGRFVYQARLPIIALWLLVLLVGVLFAWRTPAILSGGGYSFSGSESVRVDNLLINELHRPRSQLLVVFQSNTTPVTDDAYKKEINTFIDGISNLPYLAKKPTKWEENTGPDGKTTYLTLDFDEQSERTQRHIADLQKQLDNATSTGPASGYLTGQPVVAHELTQIIEQDAKHADTAVMPIALLVLLIVFGTLSAASIPILLALTVIVMTLATLYPIALSTPISAYVLSITSVVGLGISIDYSLLITRRFREELQSKGDVQEAVAQTMATAGEAILFSGVTVIIGFGGLLLIGIGIMTSIGIGGIIVVASSVISALTFLPALLAVIGKHINSLRVPLLWRFTMPTQQGVTATTAHGFWHKLARSVMRRPVIIVLLVSTILLALGWPIFSLNTGTSGANSLPSTSQARKGLDILTAQNPALATSSIDIVAQTPENYSDMLTDENLSRISHLTEWIASQPHVTEVVSLMRPPTIGNDNPTQDQLITLYTSGAYQQIPKLKQFVTSTTSSGTTYIRVKSDTKLDSKQGKELIDLLRIEGKKEAGGLFMLVGGAQAVHLDFDRYLYGNFPKAVFFIILSTYFLLLVMFRSILLPLKAVLMNMLSVSAAYGVLVYVFQWGNFSNILGFSSNGFIDGLIPIILFCVLFGLSMDYEVFLLSRIREEWLRTRNNPLAVMFGLEKTGSVITNAALLFIVVSVAFIFTTLIVTKEIGLGMTVAILVDATIIRSLLVPATMQLLGRWNWWLPQIGVEFR